MSDKAATSDAPKGGFGAAAAIAERYCDALFELAREARALEAVEAEMAALAAAIAASRDLRTVLKSPVYDAEDQTRAVLAIAQKAGFSPLVLNFIGLVARNRRLFALADMAAAFQRRMSAQRGEVVAEAVSAAPLNEDQARRLRAEIERVVGKAVNLTSRVDPELLGGLVVKVGSTMIDSSLKTKLARLKSVMKEA
jgi:F-type H+-transporting ATPase subunit delta